MASLQALLDATKPGGKLDLKAGIFHVAESVIVRGPITIVGEGASILAEPSDLRNRPNLICRGRDIHLVGAVNVFGTKPVGHGYDPEREAQHGIELQGVTNFVCEGWHVAHTWGDAVYVGKRNGRWSSNVTLDELSTEEIGRQHVTLDACRDVLIHRFHLDTGYRSVFDLEPPGHDWGAQRVRITDGVVRSKHGYLLASKGVGSTNSVADIHVSQVRCKGRLVDCMIDPPIGTRRARIAILRCTSDEIAERTPMRFNRVDGVLIRGNVQPLARGVDLFHANDCTDVVAT